MVKVLVFLATGFEEIEFSSIVDLLRRAGVEVTVAGLQPDLVEGAHGVKVLPDTSIENVDVKNFDAVICPGGYPGFENLRKNQKVLQVVKQAFESNKVVAAICGAPTVLADAGILKDKACTIYPGLEGELSKSGGKPRKKGLVVVDGKIVTSKGPATAIHFALKLAEILVGEDVAKRVEKEILADLALRKSM
ncbi:MAG: DJ-1 family glyoxalase III [Candidatus Bathyarchaeota archaeon]